MIKIRAFRAIDDQVSCHQFLEGHQKILEIYGVTKITSNTNDWMYNPGTFVVIVENEDGSKIFGGARIQVWDGFTQLPIQKAVGGYDAKIHEFVQRGSAEICGLWNSREVIGMGIGSTILGRVTASMIGNLPIQQAFMLCAPATVRMCSRVGCVLLTAVGNNGLFYYPKDDLVSTAMIIPDPAEMSHAEIKEREIILSLRQNPIQKGMQSGPKGSYDVSYNLKIPKIELSDFFVKSVL